ncbi:DUF2917 domain-containing protein [Achromobacter piechaudii]|uniref:DUF2917 domain-containing protein n=1 Tax=Achromobacter piechaudii ATCC 43553 TaxID=742159 RepID=D4X6F7_9BURK|nr:DUF2917 domain-containing protein [Achromobacter piechaudii]EFF77625.1 hypothetical protein HMPREF0004_1054 [Achromobacter piechaudii ATCC 43553]
MIQLRCTTGMSFRLASGSTMLLRRASGVRIVCRSGTVWISEYRRVDDSVLQAGDCLTVGSDRDVVLSGLPDAQVALLSQPEP